MSFKHDNEGIIDPIFETLYNLLFTLKHYSFDIYNNLES